MLISAQDGARFRRVTAAAAAAAAAARTVQGNEGEKRGKEDQQNFYSRQPGRENFSLLMGLGSGEGDKDVLGTYGANGEAGGEDSRGNGNRFFFGDDDSRLLGWLQVSSSGNSRGRGGAQSRHRHSRRVAGGGDAQGGRHRHHRRRQYLPVVDPSGPMGPFRKAPWHGNVHVLKF